MRWAGDVPVIVEGAALSDVGNMRSYNEDRAGVFAELGLALVADGMGGSCSGEVAAEFTITTVPASLQPWRGVPWRGEQRWQEHPLVTAIKLANVRILEASKNDIRLTGIGSTVVAAQGVEGGVLIAWVGDSRCYRVRGGRLSLLSRDHSLINDFQLYKPDVTPEELAALPQNVLTRALGMAPGVEVDVRFEPLQPGDLYLLCSDGLTRELTDQEIESLLRQPQLLGAACQRLIQAANEREGADNISAALVRWV